MPRIMSMRVRRMGPIFQQYITGFKVELRKNKVVTYSRASYKEIRLIGRARNKKKECSKANNKLRTQCVQKMFQELTFEASKSLISRHYEFTVVLLGFEGLPSGFCVALRLYKFSSRQLLSE